MHSGDLGSFQDACGSLLEAEVTNKAWFKSNKVGLAALNAELDAYFRANPQLSAIKNMVWSQISPKPYPLLRAKAAQVRHVASFCLALAYKHRDGVDGPGGRSKYQFPTALKRLRGQDLYA